MSTNKFNLFLENARLLSDKLGIVPLLYGSLGLEYLTGDALCSDDIDILSRAYLSPSYGMNLRRS